MSEAATVKHIFGPYLTGIGMDVGAGGDKVVPHAWAHDQVTPYTRVGGDQQQLRGDCRSFPFICDNALDFLTSCHLLEDFAYSELAYGIIPEWRRVLKSGGLLATNCPDQRKFLAHCQKTGQPVNLAHLEPDFSLQTWNQHVVQRTGPWETVFEEPNHGAYSWLQILKKV